MSFSVQMLLQGNINRLEREILLAHVLQKSRPFLYAHPEYILTPTEWSAWQTLIAKCRAGEPIAYLTGKKEFWSLELSVSPEVLIPRPETERIVELILEEFGKSEHLTVGDLGTGSGAIALALAKEKPRWTLYATDNAEKALTLARKNAADLGIQSIQFKEGYWCRNLPNQYFDLIVSNPPYIDKNDPHLEENVRQYEPWGALLAEDNGLKDLREIIRTAPAALKSGGCLFLEHGFAQAKDVRKIFIESGYCAILTYKDLSGLDRVTKGQFI